MKILIVGNGAHTKKRILPALKKINKIQSISIGDKNAEEEEIINNKTSVINLNEVFKENKNYDLGIVATPPTSHQKIYNDISSFCNKVLIEKPISNDFDWIFGEEIKLDIKNKKLFESLMYFHHPLWNIINQIIKENNIVKVVTEFCVPHQSDSSFRYSKAAGGGSLNDQGIYPISFASEIIKSSFAFEKINIFSQNDYEVDLSGDFNMIIDDELEFIGRWGLGKEYKNYANLYSNNGKEYKVDFLYSKPDDTNIKIKVFSDSLKKEINVGVYDQFYLMYESLIQNNLNDFMYTNYDNLQKRYKIFNQIYKKINL